MRRVCALCLRNSTLAVTAALLCLLSIPADSAAAISFSEYYDFSYDIEFSTTDVAGTGSFGVTVIAEATCKKKFIMSPSKVYVSGRITAENTDTQETVVLNPDYELTIEDFPSSVGDSAKVEVAVPLKFPSESSSGNYTVTAELVQAKVKILFAWSDVAGYLSSYASREVGTVTYAEAEPMTVSETRAAPAPVEETASVPEPEEATLGAIVETSSPGVALKPWYFIAGAAAVILLIVLPVTILAVRRRRDGNAG